MNIGLQLQSGNLNPNSQNYTKATVEVSKRNMKKSSIWPRTSKCIEKSSLRCAEDARGKLDQMVHTYIMAASNRGAVITRSMAVSTAKALMKQYPDTVGNIDIDKSHWV